MPAFPIHHIENYTYGTNIFPKGIVSLSNNNVHQFKDVSVRKYVRCNRQRIFFINESL